MSNPKYEDEKRLIQGLKDKDEAAFRMLVQQFGDKVRNTCYGFLQNQEDAEDVAQEVFIEAYRAIERFRGDSSISTWIYRISVNKSLNLIQKNKRRSWMTSLTRWGGGDSEEREIPIPDKEATPEEQLANQERVRILHQYIGKLAENQRIAFTLHHFEELSYKEIAEVMGTSLSAVESLIHRAKRNLHKSLKGHFDKLY